MNLKIYQLKKFFANYKTNKITKRTIVNEIPQNV